MDGLLEPFIQASLPPVNRLAWTGARRIGRRFQSQALRFFLDALQVASKAHSYANALDGLTGIAARQAINQDSLLAFELALFILQNPFSTHQAQNAGNRLLEELEARLTPDQIKAAKASAQSQSFDQIVEKVARLATG